MGGLHEGPGSPDEIRSVFDKLGGEKGVKARTQLRSATRKATQAFLEELEKKPDMGSACRKIYLEDMTRALEDAAIAFRAEMNTTEQKV